MRFAPRQLSNPRAPVAFTLVEMLMMLAIIGLAAAVVVPQMLQGGSLTVQAASRMLIADLVYAQNDAVAKQRVRRVIFEPAQNRYRVTDDHDQAISVSWKNGQAANYVVDFAQDKRFQGVSLGNVDISGDTVIEFDDLGAPNKGGTIDLIAGKFKYRITIAAFTGKVTIAPVAGG